jgi:geranylgeranyl transferase type-2 subunit alpha
MKELLEAEPEAKWALLTLTRLKELRLQVLGSCPADGAAGGSAAAELATEVAEGYARLKQLDLLRRGYYVDAEEGRAHVVAKPAAVQ